MRVCATLKNAKTKARKYDDENVMFIALSLSYCRVFVSSSSYIRIFVVVPSRIRHRYVGFLRSISTHSNAIALMVFLSSQLNYSNYAPGVKQFYPAPAKAILRILQTMPGDSVKRGVHTETTYSMCLSLKHGPTTRATAPNWI